MYSLPFTTEIAETKNFNFEQFLVAAKPISETLLEVSWLFLPSSSVNVQEKD